MPRKATLSIMGMYNYEPTLFDGFRVPESLEDKRQDIIDEICLEGAELEVIYSEPQVMKFAITRWTNLSFTVWDELQKTREYEYNPIWNKDGTYSETETRDLAGSRSEQTTSEKAENASENEQINVSGTGTSEKDSESDKATEDNISKTTESEKATEGVTTGNATETKAVQGYNSSAWADAERNMTNSSGTNEETTGETGSETTTGTGSDNTVIHEEESTTDTETTGRTKTNSLGETTATRGTEATTDTGTITRERIEKGNIGVTTTQQMIKEQREVVEFSVERYIIDSFIERFCLLIY